MEQKTYDMSEEKAQHLKLGFKQFINTEYSHRKDKSTILSDAFYPYRHDIGIKLWDALSSKESMLRCRDKLTAYFENEKDHITVSQNVSVYMSSIKKLKQYVDITFKGIDKFMELNNEELGKENPIKVIEQQEKKISYSLNVNDKHLKVPQPCGLEVKKYLSKWDNLENYFLQEKALDKLFFETYPVNSDINDVLIKVASLNDFYSTNVYYPFIVAKHIVNLNIDDRLFNGDANLVNDIASVKINEGKIRSFYSFATKYCSHHKPLEFPIYDSYVDQMLRYFRNTDHFQEFKNDDLRDYIKFKDILVHFKEFYKLEEFNFKDIDRYLWQLGQDVFPKKY